MLVHQLIDMIPKDASVLAVCAGHNEQALFSNHPNAVITNLTTGHDAHNLPFQDREFDYGFVHAGLHHCDRPHLALTELYRVSHRVIVSEARDSLLMRLAGRWRLTENYEVSSVRKNGNEAGGVNNSAVPNYVYRWTEREVEKTIRSFDPTGEPKISYFYGLRPPKGSPPPLALAAKLVFKLAKHQGNEFGFLIERPENQFPWLSIGC